MKGRNFYELGKRFDIDEITFLKPESFFEGKSSCEVHDILSFFNKVKANTNVYVVTKIPEELLLKEINKEKKYMFWKVTYKGTNKDLVYTKIGKGPFFNSN